MTNDRFWKSFWLLLAGATLLCIAGRASIFFIHIGSINTAAVGMDYAPDKDPFETSLRTSALPALTGGFLYKDALPLGISAWAWDATLDWRSGGETYDGNYALRTVFAKAWAGLGISGMSSDLYVFSTYSLKLVADPISSSPWF